VLLDKSDVNLASSAFLLAMSNVADNKQMLQICYLQVIGAVTE